jgi:transposase
VWLARITERGWVRSSFVPPEEIRVLRAHTRYRRRLIQARTAQLNRTGKLLEEGHLKLSSVISKLHGVSGMPDLTDQLTAQIEDLDADIAVLAAPFQAEIARLDDVDGIARRTAEDVIAETGVNMTVFASGLAPT